MENNDNSLSRRSLLKTGGASLIGLGAGSLITKTLDKKNSDSSSYSKLQYPFRDTYQSGIVTPAQQQMYMVSYDLITKNKNEVIQLLKNWTTAAEAMMSGKQIKPQTESKNYPPDDTGETLDMGPYGLTITFGVGKSFFLHPTEKDRYGLARLLPQPLEIGIPKMAAEKINPQQSAGDLVIQICAEDPMVALHAVHDLNRIAFGTATVKWMQLGYGRTSSTSTKQKTPRNLFGFKDGTSNITKEDTSGQKQFLWVDQNDNQGDWLKNGTYLCSRRIRMQMEVWDELILGEQEKNIGRDKIEGAPLSGGTEFTAPDFHKTAPNGEKLIDPTSHVAIVNPTNNNGKRILRRGFNYTNGADELGKLNAGLFFIAFTRNPQKFFVPYWKKCKMIC